MTVFGHNRSRFSVAFAGYDPSSQLKTPSLPHSPEEIALKHKQAYLRQQYRLRLERYETIKVIDREETQQFKYYCMVKCPGESPYLASLPPEGYYDVPRLFYDLEMPTGKELEAAVGASSDQTTLSLPSLGNFDPNNPEHLELIKVMLNNNSSQLEGNFDLEAENPENGQKPEWTQDVDPLQLVADYRSEIDALIRQGMKEPFKIAQAILGDKVTYNKRPYAGKKGVKFLIENIVKRGDN